MWVVLYLGLSGQKSTKKNVKKALKSKTNNFHSLRTFCAREELLPLLISIRLFLVC